MIKKIFITITIVITTVTLLGFIIYYHKSSLSYHHNKTLNYFENNKDNLLNIENFLDSYLAEKSPIDVAVGCDFEKEKCFYLNQYQSYKDKINALFVQFKKGNSKYYSQEMDSYVPVREGVFSTRITFRSPLQLPSCHVDQIDIGCQDKLSDNWYLVILRRGTAYYMKNSNDFKTWQLNVFDRIFNQ